MVPFDCPKCSSSDIVLRGKRYNKSGVKQLYRCNSCRSKFVEPDGFERMRHKKQDIVRAVHQYNDGLSLFKVQYHLYQHDNVKISRESIRLWDKRFGVFLKSTSPKRKTYVKRKATLG